MKDDPILEAIVSWLKAVENNDDFDVNRYAIIKFIHTEPIRWQSMLNLAKFFLLSCGWPQGENMTALRQAGFGVLKDTVDNRWYIQTSKGKIAFAIVNEGMRQ